MEHGVQTFHPWDTTRVQVHLPPSQEGGATIAQRFPGFSAQKLRFSVTFGHYRKCSCPFKQDMVCKPWISLCPAGIELGCKVIPVWQPPWGFPPQYSRPEPHSAQKWLFPLHKPWKGAAVNHWTLPCLILSWKTPSDEQSSDVSALFD